MLVTKDPRFIKIYKALEPYIAEFGIKQISVFGSYARGDEKPNSDIDIIVDIRNPVSIYQFIGLKQDISKSLDKKVDLFKPGNLEPEIKNNILKEAVTIYEQR